MRDPAKDKAAAFYWPLLTELFTYAANRIAAGWQSQPAADIVAIDQAMKTGFQLGAWAVRDDGCGRGTGGRPRRCGPVGCADVAEER